jgi:hypothetical protein
MIIVTGTKRSGTSMWMQILRASGIEVIGADFPGRWGETIRDANPGGFYESIFRNGINFRTNPNPATGEYLHPYDTRHHAVKVFVPGLIRSDLAFVTKVLGTMRPWREYHHSVARLYAMEHENRTKSSGKDEPMRAYITGALEWWNDNFSLIRDAIIRRYPLHMMSYEATLEDPDRTIRTALEWLGLGDIDAAVAAVRSELRTQRTEAVPEIPEIDEEAGSVFDRLYERVHESRPLDRDFIDTMNALHIRLEPRITEERRRVHREEARRLREREGGEAPPDPPREP